MQRDTPQAGGVEMRNQCEPSVKKKSSKECVVEEEVCEGETR